MSCMTKCDWCGSFDFCDIHEGLFMCATCMSEDSLDHTKDDDSDDEEDYE